MLIRDSAWEDGDNQPSAKCYQTAGELQSRHIYEKRYTDSRDSEIAGKWFGF
jgi:hypothetical protein